MATVRIKEDAYRDLNALAGRFQTKLKRPVSVDETIKYLLEREKLKPSDFAGAWKMNDDEEAEVLESLRRLWSRRKPQEGNSRLNDTH